MDVLRYWRTVIRSGVIGVWVGILPGVGEDMAAWSSYAAAKRLSKEPEKYGKGSVEGLMAAETGDNASVPGGIIPALALAIPGSAPCAVLLAAMIIHGVQPGPMLMVENPRFVYEVVAMVLFSTLGILFFGLFFIRPMLKIVQIPRTIMMPIIFVLCTTGSFALASRLFDVWTMLGFGTLIFFMRRHGYPAAPFVLGLVLGDILDKSLRRGLVLSDGDLLPFVTRPISAILALLVVYTFVTNVPSVDRAVRRWGRSILDTVFGQAKEGRVIMLVSLCNEVIRELSFEEQCAFAKKAGYDGLEIAPFTLDAEPHRLSPARRAAIRKAAVDAGIAITGLHYLLVAPQGLSITSSDAGQRARTIAVMRGLCDLAADLGGRVLVHGSPAQRTLEPGEEAEGRKRAADCFAEVAESAAKRRGDVLHRTAGARRDRRRQHGGGSRRDRGRRRQPCAENHDRLLRSSPHGDGAGARPDPPLVADGRCRAHPFQ